MGDLSWIKIDTDIFNNEKMMLIESMPNGDELMLVWFKLLCHAGRSNESGRFTIGGRPYTDEFFARIFRCESSLIKEAMEVFLELGMIVRDDDGAVRIKNWKKYQSVEQLELVREQMRDMDAKQREKLRSELVREQTKDRVAKHREKQKSERKKQSAEKEEAEDVMQCNASCNADVTQCNADVTQCNAECNADVTQCNADCNADVTVDVTQCNASCNASCNAECNAECNANEEIIEENRIEKNRIEESRVEKNRVEESRTDSTDSTYVTAARPSLNYTDSHSRGLHTIRTNDLQTSKEERLLPISGNGKNVVYLTDGQVADLKGKLGEGLYQAYLSRLSTFIIEKRARIKFHYETILRWYEEDKRDGMLPITDSVYKGALTEKEEPTADKAVKSDREYVRKQEKSSYKQEDRPRWGDFDPKDAYIEALKNTFGDDYEIFLD